MRPGPGELLHFSEDPTLTVFHPHVAPTAHETTAYVWAVDAQHSPSYWFPRRCPRAMAWTTPETDPADAVRLLGPATTRVHVIEYDWLPTLQTTTLYAYRFPAAPFRPLDDGHAHVATTTVEPLGPAEPVGDLLAAHRDAAIDLRLTTDLWPWWDQVTASTLGFSGIRLRNARPRP